MFKNDRKTPVPDSHKSQSSRTHIRKPSTAANTHREESKPLTTEIPAGSAHNRLYKLNEQKKDRIQNLKEKYNTTYSFKPKIIEKSPVAPKASMVGQVQFEKSEDGEKKMTAIDREVKKNCSFSPKINKSSKKLFPERSI